MAASAWSAGRAALPHHRRWDIMLTGLAAAHGVLLLQFPSLPFVALGVWWNSNTISHNFVHRPFFRARAANVAFGLYLSGLLGIPQAFWRDRHLAHHAGIPPRVRRSAELFAQLGLVLGLWVAFAILSSRFFWGRYLPGYLFGLLLCQLHGYYEHARGTTSYYGKLYNALFLNDGYHGEHHANPAIHWTSLPERVEAPQHVSRWPAPLRWIDDLGLEGLERLALRWPPLQRYLLRTHAKAIGHLVKGLPQAGRVVIVGGGLFPRTAIILRRLFPNARICILDADRGNLDKARRYLGEASNQIELEHGRYCAGDTIECDLLVTPLCFTGDRAAISAPVGDGCRQRDT